MFSPLVGHVFVDIDLTGFVFSVGFVITVSFDWVEPEQEHVSYDAKTEQIAFGIVRLLVFSTVFDDLGSHVAHCPATFVTLSRYFLI